MLFLFQPLSKPSSALEKSMTRLLSFEVRKTLEAEAAAGNASKVLEAWRTEQTKAPTPKLGFQRPCFVVLH